MKQFLKTCCTVVLVILTIGSGCLSAIADSADEKIIGDTDRDGIVTIFDVTRIQRYLAHMVALDDDMLLCADVDLDGDVSISDVTYIRQYLAQYTTPYDAFIGASADDAATLNLIRTYQSGIADYTVMKGVDISTFNGDVDMNILKAQGYDFVMIRMGYGSDESAQDDSRFESNVQKAEAAGLYWGAYLYSYALTETEARSEVQHAIRLLKGKTPTMPIAFDMEDGDGYKSRYGMPSDETLVSICKIFLSGIRDAGYYPILYSALSWLNHSLNDSTLLDNYDIWCAQWYTECEYTGSTLGMWQFGGEVNYLESPTISGLSGSFDKNYCYIDYPDIIRLYGYNNFPALLYDGIASTSAGDDDTVVSHPVPGGYNGYMGMQPPL